jgi:hypothetical protein
LHGTTEAFEQSGIAEIVVKLFCLLEEGKIKRDRVPWGLGIDAA